MIEISNFLYNLVRGLASHLLSDPETRRNLFPPLPPLNNVFFISFFFLVAFLFIVQYFVRQFSHCAINSFCPNGCVVLVTWVINKVTGKKLFLQKTVLDKQHINFAVKSKILLILLLTLAAQGNIQGDCLIANKWLSKPLNTSLVQKVSN